MMSTQRAWTGRIRRFHVDERGMSLPEVLVGTIIGALIMGVVVSTIFTTTDLRLRADDRNELASDLSITSLSFDRDGIMAGASAPAKSQTSSTSCATPIDLGFDEGGASVRYRTSSGAFQRVSGAGTRTLIQDVTSCTWQADRIGSGRYTIVVNLTVTRPSGETLSQTLRVAPRMW